MQVESAEQILFGTARKVYHLENILPARPAAATAARTVPPAPQSAGMFIGRSRDCQAPACVRVTVGVRTFVVAAQAKPTFGVFFPARA